jgi:hypothetical protein
MADQAASSLSNFALGIFVARQTTADAFGAFSIAFVTYLFVLNLGRAVVAQPLLIRHSGGTTRTWRDGVETAIGVAALLGVAAGAVCFAIGLLFRGQVGPAFAGLALAMPGLLVQDAWRFAFFAARRERAALVNDLIWVGGLVVTFACLAVTNTTSVFAIVVAWGAAAAVAAIGGIVQSKVMPRIVHSAIWFRTHSDLIPRFSVEVVVRMGASQISYYALGLISGLAAVGAIRAGDLLLGPFNILFQGIHLIALPEARRQLDRSTAALRRWCRILAIAIGAAGLAYGLICVTLPTAVGEALLGQSGEPAQAVLVPLIVALIGLVSGAGAGVGLRALEAADRTLRAAFVGSVVTIVGAIAGAIVGDAPGAAWGFALGAWAGALAHWLEFRAALMEEPQPRVGPDDSGETERAEPDVVA